MIDPQVIKRLRANPDFRVFQKHIERVLDGLDHLPNTTGKDDRAIAIETVGREWARDKLAEILAPVHDFRQRDDIEDRAEEMAEELGL